MAIDLHGVKNKRFLIITSIANDDNKVLKNIAKECKRKEINFILVGDKKSPENFKLKDCDFLSIQMQKKLNSKLAKSLPYNHYARKNLGYLMAIANDAKCIIETDDDNLPFDSFWKEKIVFQTAHLIKGEGWVNVFKYYTDKHIWPRGYALEKIHNINPKLDSMQEVKCAIQHGLVDENPDVDAIYRLTNSLPFSFQKGPNIAIGENTICPFNSQNTTWFEEAYPLLYLPSHCSFRMTDIWRSFIAQRISWTCNWSILFHQSTARQERNLHDLMCDFKDEIPGYCNNKLVVDSLLNLDLKNGQDNIYDNLIDCYKLFIELKLIAKEEMKLVYNWIEDLTSSKLIL